MFKAQCHCGDISLSTDQAPPHLTSCNCSICHRLGAVWAYYLTDEVSIESEGELDTYRWGKQSITYHRCRRCGCTTHYSAKRKDGTPRIAINARMAPLDTLETIPLRYFDGADSWQFVDPPAKETQ